MIKTTCTIYYNEGLLIKSQTGKNVRSDDIVTEFDIELRNKCIHVLYSNNQNRVFEYNSRFNEDDPKSVQYVPFRYPVIGIKIEKQIQISDNVICPFN